MAEQLKPQHSRSYGILGTGAVGGFYGARLQRAGLDVHFLLRNDYQYVKKHGLVIESPEGNFTLPHVQAYNDVHQMPPCDGVVVALKSTQNHLLPQLLPPLMKENSVVLVLQNGLGVEPDVAKIVGLDRVIGGLCFICSNKVGFGQIRHLDYSEVRLGEYRENYQPGGITERLCRIGEDFKSAGIPVELSEDLMLARWQKLVWNIPYNGLSVVLNARTDQLMANPDTRQLVEDLMGEVILGAKGCDRIIPDHFIQKMLDHTDKMTPYRTSMKIDYDERRPLELEAIVGNPLRVANQRGLQLNRIAMLYSQLKFLDTQNRA